MKFTPSLSPSDNIIDLRDVGREIATMIQDAASHAYYEGFQDALESTWFDAFMQGMCTASGVILIGALMLQVFTAKIKRGKS